MSGCVSSWLDGYGFDGGFAFIAVVFILLSIIGVTVLVDLAHGAVKDYEKSRP
ncbi:sporulation protein YjcZ [Peribacillus butanolivorans]|uniref:Sporulation protein YjcZ n=1 Tax=Peribacillus butanolivorans TaxID=421767 RepID=A0ABM6XPW2_9BACI|nr:sporulation protein YjcZ [Peribacillus butanolivorans]AXN40629.1 sporulation protein YjcZ [Peribacillus butanolivorans]MED3687278.1 sporulation protein YjcZ [Peribacillus butanolivorans]QNU05487.1 sporulation protein YjcZ [Peribacillus butanolivorans]